MMMKLMMIKNRHKSLLLMLFCTLFLSVSAQNGNLKVTGVIVSSEDNLPIPGVSVVVKGTTNGTITNMDGVYNLAAKKGDVLVFSFIGMQIQEKTVDKAKIDVLMSPESFDIDEVVAIGYGVQKRKEVTGAVTQVKSDQIDNFVTPDLGSALQGQVAGVTVNALSGEPGEGSSILIRGLSSITGGNDPLWVVDGIPQPSDPRLSMNEIESLDILKDAASCAVYGTRGASGVILVTTKGGTEGTAKISVTGSYGIRNIMSGTPVMNSTEQLYFEMNRINYVDEMSGVDNLITNQNPHWLANESNLDDMFLNDNSMTQNYGITISGGTKQMSYSLVAGYYEEEGVFLNSNFKRFNTRANTVYRSKNNKLSINGSIAVILEDKQKPGTNFLNTILKYKPYQPQVSPDTELAEAGSGTDRNNMNAVLTAMNKKDNTNTDRINTSFLLNYEIIKGLKLRAQGGVAVINTNQSLFNPRYALDLNFDEGREEDPTKSYSGFASTRAANYNAETGLNYTTKINKHHKITGLLNFSYEEYNSGKIQGQKQGVYNNNVEVINGATIFPTLESQGYRKTVTVGTLARVQYDFKSKYMLSALVRRDGSSRFGSENRWGTFPSFSAGWNISDEDFWSTISNTINSLKLRASYGQTGNDKIGDYLYNNLYVFGYDQVFQQGASDIHNIGVIQDSYGNPDVKWETSIQQNIGIDMGFLSNKITFNADFYNTEKKDMLFPVRLPTSAGVGTKGTYTANVGNMRNLGYELAARYRFKTGDFSWDLSGTFTQNKNEVSDMYGETEIIYTTGQVISGDASAVATTIADGYEAGAFFLYQTDGIVKSDAQLAEYQKLVPTARLGDLIYKDMNGDGVIDDKDKAYSGSAFPDFETGLNIKVDYKGFDLSMQWYASVGAEIINGSKATAFTWGRHSDLAYMWTPNNPDSNIPIYVGDSKTHPNYSGATDLWVEDASYLRLKMVSLGYNFSNRITHNLGMSNMRVYVTAQNPLTITNYEGYDPEIGSSNLNNRGIDRGNYPVSALYLIGLKLDF